MVFFENVKNFLFGESKTKEPQEERKNPLELPAHACEKIKTELDEFKPIAIQKTLDLTTGIPDDIKQTLSARILEDYSHFAREENVRMADVFFPLIENLDWHWLEWDFWQPICIKRKTFTNGMRCWCFPWADELNLEYERTEYDPSKVFNIMTLKTAKERLTAFPEAEAMKRAELIEFLSENETAWLAVIDPHIRAKWDRQKHYNGPTPKDVFSLMLHTIEDRARCLRDIEKIKKIGGKPKENFSFLYDEELAAYAKRNKKNPWKESFGPSIPGLSIFITGDFPKTK